MTKKENLYVEYLKVQNEINALGGKELVNIEEYAKTWKFRNSASDKKVYEWENLIEHGKRMLEETKQEIARNQWLETEEGKAFKEKNFAAREAIKNAQCALYEDTNKMLSNFVKELLGDEFDLIHFGWGSFEVGLTDGYYEDGKPRKLFGHAFTVHFGNDWFKKDFRWELNYGTMGGFDLTEDSKRTKYLVGMATFASSPKVLGELKETLKQAEAKVNALAAEASKLEREFKNAGI